MIDKDSIAFDVVDEETVRRLWFDDPDLLPHLQVDKTADIAYNKSRINSIVLSGILRGQSVDGMAFTLANLSKTNMSSAVSSIRTAVTSAENGGRLSRLQAIEAAGVTGLGKQWLATGDDRTRESHMAVNGEIVKPQERFSNGLLCPGDPAGAASEVYNCRCSMRTVLDGVNSESAAQYTEDAQAAFERWQENRFKSSGGVSNGFNITRYTVTDQTIKQVEEEIQSLDIPRINGDEKKKFSSAIQKLLKYAKKFPNRELAYTLSFPQMTLNNEIILGGDSVVIPDRQHDYIAIHNHPDNSPLTHTDLRGLCARTRMKGIGAVGNKGKITIAIKDKKFDRETFMEYLDSFQEEIESCVKEKNLSGYLKTMQQIAEGAEDYGVHVVGR